MQTTCKLEGGGGQKSGKFANVVYECPLTAKAEAHFLTSSKYPFTFFTDFVDNALIRKSR